jgi:acetylornithine deacetylase/succinyl-diaminopimelate desuccinylase-like protein
MRLVKGMDYRVTADRLIEHIRKQGYFIVDQEPTGEIRKAHPKVAMVVRHGGENAQRISMDLPISQEVIRTVESARGPAVKSPTSGGTVPNVAEEILGMPSIEIPIANHDDNQHTSNENLRLQNLWDGINLFAALLTM